MKIIFLTILIILSFLILVGFIIQILHILQPLFRLLKYMFQYFVKSIEVCSSQNLNGTYSRKFTHQLLDFYHLKQAYAVKGLPVPLSLGGIGFFPHGLVIEASKRAKNRL